MQLSSDGGFYSLCCPLQLVEDPPLPSHVRDPKQGTVRLERGDFIVLQLQFRVGNDSTIAKDWQALDVLDALVIPWTPWDYVTPPAFFSPFLPTVHSVPAINFGPFRGRMICARFDHNAVHNYYADFIEHDQDTYMRSHFGSPQTDVINGLSEYMYTMGDRLLKRIADEGNMGMLVQRLRECGMEDIASKITQ